MAELRVILTSSAKQVEARRAEPNRAELTATSYLSKSIKFSRWLTLNHTITAAAVTTTNAVHLTSISVAEQPSSTIASALKRAQAVGTCFSHDCNCVEVWHAKKTRLSVRQRLSVASADSARGLPPVQMPYDFL